MQKFETEIPVQPRDIDINGHVHHSIYLDYLLTARFDQMKRCYKVSMEDFLAMGYTWFARTYTIEFRTAVAFGDCVLVRTWVEDVGKATVDVAFEIESRNTGALAAHGTARYVLIESASGRPAKIPAEIIAKYSI
ncbi:acyl-CoA thioesterase [bacterium]|nr:acyl-CoA thioesterase [bacterium]